VTTGIDLVLADHRRVEGLFARFDETNDATVVGVIVDALTAHDQAEQAALYPLLGAVLGDADLVQEAGRAHSLVKQSIERLLGLEGAPLVDAVAALRQAVEDHVRDEEADLLPALEDAATPGQLDGLAVRFELAKQRVG
jgi:hemerythrin superfamily protein